MLSGCGATLPMDYSIIVLDPEYDVDPDYSVMPSVNFTYERLAHEMNRLKSSEKKITDLEVKLIWTVSECYLIGHRIDGSQPAGQSESECWRGVASRTPQGPKWFLSIFNAAKLELKWHNEKWEADVIFTPGQSLLREKPEEVNGLKASSMRLILERSHGIRTVTLCFSDPSHEVEYIAESPTSSQTVRLHFTSQDQYTGQSESIRDFFGKCYVRMEFKFEARPRSSIVFLNEHIQKFASQAKYNAREFDRARFIKHVINQCPEDKDAVLSVKCETQTFYVNKNLLAFSSPVFRSCLENKGFSETQRNSYTITDFSPEVVEQLLVFCECGIAPEADNIWPTLAEAADYFQVKNLLQLAQIHFLKELVEMPWLYTGDFTVDQFREFLDCCVLANTLNLPLVLTALHFVLRDVVPMFPDWAISDAWETFLRSGEAPGFLENRCAAERAIQRVVNGFWCNMDNFADEENLDLTIGTLEDVDDMFNFYDD